MRRATAAVLALSTLLCAVDAARLAPKLPDPRAGASAVSASNSTETTGCEACCGGGSCSSAFRGTPGTCCGVVDDQSFCCPTAASSFGEGQCYRPDASTFRCRAAGTSKDSGDDRPSPWYSLFSLLIPVALLAACCMACFRKPRTQQPMPVGQQYYGQGAPPPGAVYGYPATGQPYQSGGGYGASNLAGAGAFPPPVPPPPLSVPDARAPSAPPLVQTTHYPAM